MQEIELVQIVAAVVGGNVLTGVWVYFLWRASKVEDAADLPFSVISTGIIPPLVTAFGTYLWF